MTSNDIQHCCIYVTVMLTLILCKFLMILVSHCYAEYACVNLCNYIHNIFFN